MKVPILVADLPSQNHFQIWRDLCDENWSKETISRLLFSCVNREAKELARNLKLDDRMESLAMSEACLTLKDHKNNFNGHLLCCLINPVKSEMGRVSKKLLENVVETLDRKAGVNVWRNTDTVIDWFSNNKSKERHSFISFNIVNFIHLFQRNC